MIEAVAVVSSVAILAGCGLRGLAMVLAHREKKFEHLPLVKLEAKLDELENKLLSRAMSGR